MILGTVCIYPVREEYNVHVCAVQCVCLREKENERAMEGERDVACYTLYACIFMCERETARLHRVFHYIMSLYIYLVVSACI